jgi:FkbM family methyltransferase
MKNAYKTLRWLIKDFSVVSIIYVFLYYLKKKLKLLDYKKIFYVKFNFNGKKITIFLRENNDDFAIIREIFLFEAYKTPFKGIKKIVDAGSHIGASAIYFNSVFPNCKIMCIEPNKKNLILLKKNIRLNKLDCNVVNKVLSNKEKTVNFYFDFKNPAYSRIPEKGRFFNEKIKAITLNKIQEKIKNIDLLKLDIEGEEEGILKKLEGLKIKRVILETHFDKYPKEFDLVRILKKQGFKILPKMSHWRELNKSIEYPFMIFKKDEK